MNLIINGKEESVDNDQVTIAQLLTLKNVEAPDMVSVQINGEFCERDTFETVTLKDKDEVDFLYFMGGGR